MSYDVSKLNSIQKSGDNYIITDTDGNQKTIAGGNSVIEHLFVNQKYLTQGDKTDDKDNVLSSAELKDFFLNEESNRFDVKEGETEITDCGFENWVEANQAIGSNAHQSEGAWKDNFMSFMDLVTNKVAEKEEAPKPVAQEASYDISKINSIKETEDGYQITDTNGNTRNVEGKNVVIDHLLEQQSYLTQDDKTDNDRMLSAAELTDFFKNEEASRFSTDEEGYEAQSAEELNTITTDEVSSWIDKNKVHANNPHNHEAVWLDDFKSFMEYVTEEAEAQEAAEADEAAEDVAPPVANPPADEAPAAQAFDSAENNLVSEEFITSREVSENGTITTMYSSFEHPQNLAGSTLTAGQLQERFSGREDGKISSHTIFTGLNGVELPVTVEEDYTPNYTNKGLESRTVYHNPADNDGLEELKSYKLITDNEGNYIVNTEGIVSEKIFSDGTREVEYANGAREDGAIIVKYDAEGNIIATSNERNY